MKKNIIFGLSVLLLILIPGWRAFAANTCSENGYTVLTVNGIWTDENGAKNNSLNLRRKLIADTFNNQPLYVDYLYNATHLAGVSDLVDSAAQGAFNEKSDFDLTNIINDASQKVTTQKVLLVAHSQGNFYSNNFYQKIASKQGGVPKESIGVYSVATPASYVAGDGKYLTSDTDAVIASTVAKFINILKPNIHIPLVASDGNGHSFSSVYLKYKGDRIVSDIKDSLNKLKDNDEQDKESACISPQKITLLHKIKGVAFAVADPTALGVKYVLVKTYDGTVYVLNKIQNTAFAAGNAVSHLFANVLSSFSEDEIPTGVIVDNSNTPVVVENNQAEPLGEVIREDQYPPIDETLVEDIEVVDSTEESEIVVNIPNIGRGPGGQNKTGQNNNGGGGGGGTSDTTSPVITLLGTDPMDVIKGATFSDPGATALDAVDGVTSVVTTGTVDMTTVGTYTLTYTSTDAVGNVATLTRTVNVVVDTGFPIITLNGDAEEFILKNSTYVDPGATATDAIDGALTVTVSGAVDTSTLGTYTLTYSTTDSSGNTTTKDRVIKVSTYKYIPKYKFGNENGDGRDWQTWWFNGSSVYDWTDTYVNNYLREQFKIKTITGGYWCSQCLQRGVFTHDPQKGFESTDLSISTLEGNPQNNMNGVLYDVVIQWDATGYTYAVSHNGITDSTGHTNVTNMNNDMWVGWDGSFNNFQTFPSGSWSGTISGSVMDRTGGGDMVLEPFPVYKNPGASLGATLSVPNKGVYTTNGISPTRGRKNLTPFNFEVIYTDLGNNAPQNVKLYATNTTTSTTVAPVDLQKITPGAEDVSDGSFTNGEAYVAGNITYDLGDYEYYFIALDNAGNSVRLPASGAFRFQAIPSTYTYIPKYAFGSNNGDGNNWQAWMFNGSVVYDWTDTYVNNYLKEQFKIKTIPGGFWCSQCLQRGVFNHDPQKGFETYDLTKSGLENNPQSNSDGKVYDVTMQWDATGYTYTIAQGGAVVNSGHTNISGINNDYWVGWDGSFNNFQTFSSGTWIGSSTYFPTGYTGGSDMVLQPYPIYYYTGPVLSDEKKILTFDFSGLSPVVNGTVDEVNHTVALSVPPGTDVTSLVPTITISTNAQISPVSGVAQDFTNPVTYTVTAENSSTQSYVVTVTISSDTTAPSVTSYTLNGSAASPTVNPSASNPLAIVINASENVNWMSLKIENDADHTLYKMFMSDSGGCVDGTNTCTKSWDGVLSSGGLLQSGMYKIKLHIKDPANNEFYDYLTPYVINVDTTI